MATAVIIQARCGSSRLPGKVMMDLGGKPMIARVIERCALIPGIHKLICAVPDTDQNDDLAQWAGAAGAIVVRGPEHDVLARYYQAAKTWHADVVVRVTADCPLIDPEVVGRVIALRKREGAEYASNVWPRSFPKGLDCECFTFGALERAHREATDSHDREHVTPWIVRNFTRVNVASGQFGLARLRWVVDYREDLEFVRAIWAVRPPGGMADVLAILSEHPEIVAHNVLPKASAA